MDLYDVEGLEEKAIIVIVFVFLFIFGVLGMLLWYGWKSTRRKITVCPYTKQPLMLGVDMAKTMANYVQEYMSSQEQPDNPPFVLEKAAICQDTGRIFPDCVVRGEKISLDWSFLEKRHTGKYVSWGSLSEVQKATIRLCHNSLDGFQTESSSPHQLPKNIESVYVYTKPGPLYVDIFTNTLLGWKIVPGTELEVLIVQKPKHESIDETI